MIYYETKEQVWNDGDNPVSIAMGHKSTGRYEYFHHLPAEEIGELDGCPRRYPDL